MIQIYSKNSCPNCTKLIKLITDQQLKYEIVKVDENQTAREWLLAQGHKSVPQLYIGDTLITGDWGKQTSLTEEQLIQLK
jgi:glutaredoxin